MTRGSPAGTAPGLFHSLRLTLTLHFSPTEKIQDHCLSQTPAEGEQARALGTAVAGGAKAVQTGCRGVVGGPRRPEQGWGAGWEPGCHPEPGSVGGGSGRKQDGRPGQGQRDLLNLMRVSLLGLCGPTQTDRERGAGREMRAPRPVSEHVHPVCPRPARLQPRPLARTGRPHCSHAPCLGPVECEAQAAEPAEAGAARPGVRRPPGGPGGLSGPCPCRA